jgi:phosphoglycolate phosphatase-like HAD superfamily hydrolase
MSIRRLLLFDIDGTLVWGGPAKIAFEQALVETFGTTGDTAGVSFAGKTDPQIARELLSGIGFARDEVEAGFDALWDRYLGHLERHLVDRPMEVLPGVTDLLDALTPLEDVGMGLLTGNIEGGARLKLGSASLWERFHMGSYGSDHEERDELPGIALERARRFWGREVEPDQAVVIGDTPRDVQCGKKGGVRTLAVATGSYGADELHATGADRVVTDLASTDDVVRWLLAD